MKGLVVFAGAVFAALSGWGYAYTVTTNEERVVTVRVDKEAEVFNDVLRTPFLAPDVESVIYRMNGEVLYLSSKEPSTYTGGTSIISSQVRPSYNGVFGSGPIEVVDGSQFVQADTEILHITNKLVFADGHSWALGMDDNHFLTLHCLGSTSATRCANLGRGNGNLANVMLALDDPESEALHCMNLRGKLLLTIAGGTIRAGSGAQTPFFVDTDPSAPKTIQVPEPFTFRTEEGAETDPGMPLDLARLGGKSVDLETVTPPNNSFELGNTGWLAEKDEAINALPGVLSNGNTTWVGPGTNTPYGSKFMTLRSGQKMTMTQAVELANEGSWYVTFAYATRNGYSSHRIDMQFTLSNATERTEQTLTLKGGSSHPFVDAEVGPFKLTPGNYVLKIKNTWNREADKENYGALSYDNINFVRRGIVRNLSLTKTGKGKLTLSNACIDDDIIKVDEGVLALTMPEVNRTTLEVADGARLALYGTALKGDAKVTVAAGGTLSLLDVRQNLVAKGDFEQPVIPEDGQGYMGWNQTIYGWTWVRGTASGDTGIQRNGGTMSAGNNFKTMFGKQTMYLRGGSQASQKVKVPADGTYRLSFIQSFRDYQEGFRIKLHVTIDDEEVMAVGPSAAYYDFKRFATEVELTAGEHVLKFDAADRTAQGCMMFIDDVSLGQVGPSPTFEGPALELSSGSTLDLQNAEPLQLEEGTVLVDGKPVRGTEKSLRRVGVNVIGNGTIRIGERLGLLILFN